MNEHLESEPVSLADILVEIKHYRRFLICNTIIWLSIAALYVAKTPNEYSAATSIVLTPTRITSANQANTSGNSVVQLDSFQAESQIQVLRSERNLQTVFAIYKNQIAPTQADSKKFSLNFASIANLLRPDADRTDKDLESNTQLFQAFADKVNVRRVGASYVLELTYRAASPKLAAQVANSITSQYLFSQIELKAASVEKGGEVLQNRISDIQAQRTAAKDAVQNGQIPSIVLPDADAQIISAATVPTRKSWPLTGLTLIFAFSMSIFFALIYVVIRNALHPTIKSARAIVRHLNLHCLCVIDKKELPSRRHFELNFAHPETFNQNKNSFVTGVSLVRRALLSNGVMTSGRATSIVPMNSGFHHAICSISLSLSLSLENQNILLADFDSDDAMLTLLIAPETKIGLYNIDLTVDSDAINLTKRISNYLRFMPARDPKFQSGQGSYIWADKYRNFLSGILESNLTVACLPRFKTSMDLRGAGKLLSNAIIVVEAGNTPLHIAREIVSTLRMEQVNIVGVILLR